MTIDYTTPFKTNFPNSRDLLSRPKSIILFELITYAKIIDSKFKDYFKPIKKGLYIKGTTKSLIDNIDIYTLLNNNKDTKIQELSIPENLISKRLIAEKVKYLDTVPIVNPYVITYIKVYLMKFLYRREHPFTIKNILSDKGIDNYEYLHNEIEVILSNLTDQIYDFIGDDFYFIYNISIYNTDLIIKKVVDYRIYEWTLNQEKDSYNENELIEIYTSIAKKDDWLNIQELISDDIKNHRKRIGR